MSFDPTSPTGARAGNDPFEPAAAKEWVETERFLQAVAERMLRGADGGDDAVQEAFVRVLAGNSHPRRSERGWLASIVRNVVRSRARRGQLESDAIQGRSQLRPEHDPSAADRAARDEVRSIVLRAVEELEEPYRTVLRARYFEGLTPAETAERLDCSVNTVQTRSRRAIERLRERLDRQLGQGDHGENWLLLLLPPAWVPSGVGESNPSSGVPLESPGPVASSGSRWLARAGWVAAPVLAGLLVWAVDREDLRAPTEDAGEPIATARTTTIEAPAPAPPSAEQRVPVGASATEPAATPVETTAEPETREVVVRVLEPDGSPVANATVIALRDLSAAEREEVAALGIEATSVGEPLGRVDSAGELEVELDQRFAIHPEIVQEGEWLTLRAEMPGYTGSNRLHYLRYPTRDGARFDLILEPGGVAAQVRVVSPEGLEVEGFVAFGGANARTVESSPDRLVLENPGTARTDAHGGVLLHGLPVGSVPIRAVAPGYAPTEAYVETRRGETVECVLELRQPAVLSGVALGAAGEPVAGAEVSVSYLVPGNGTNLRRYQTSTAEDGSFDFTGLPPGELWARASSTADPALCAARRWTVEPGIRLSWTAYLEADPPTGFQVSDASGAPVTGAFVSLDSQGRDWRRAGLTDESGEARFHGVPEGPFDALIYREMTNDQMSLVPDAVIEGLGRGQVLPVTLANPTPASPVEGRLVTFEVEQLPTGRLIVFEEEAVYPRSVELASDGSFRFDALSGTAELVALLDGWGSVSFGEHEFRSGQARDLGQLQVPNRRSVENPLLEADDRETSSGTRILFERAGQRWSVSPEAPTTPELFLLPGTYRLGEAGAKLADTLPFTVE